MRALKELEQNVSSGQLEITQILAPPRSLSTAIEVALTEAADGQLHEPFHPRRSHSLEESLQLILDRFKQLQDKSESSGVHIINKDLAKHIGQEDWKILENIISNIVFVVREPTLQQFSLIKQRLNEIWLGSYNDSSVGDTQVFENVTKLKSKEWANESWSHMDEFLDAVESDPHLRSKAVILSELTLLLNPHQTMKELAERFKWTPFNEKMTRGWSKAVGKNFHHVPLKDVEPKFDEDGVLLSGWIGKAIRSKEFLKPDANKNKAKSIEKYPPDIQEYFLEELLPIYVRFVTHPLHLRKDTVDYQQLAKLNSIEAYVLLKVKINKNNGEELLLEKLASELKNKHPLIFGRLQEILGLEIN